MLSSAIAGFSLLVSTTGLVILLIDSFFRNKHFRPDPLVPGVVRWSSEGSNPHTWGSCYLLERACRLPSEVDVWTGMEPFWDCKVVRRRARKYQWKSSIPGGGLTTQGQSGSLLFEHRRGHRCHIPSCNREPNNLAKHPLLQSVIHRKYLLFFWVTEYPGESSSDFRFWYLFHITTFGKVWILARSAV